LHRWSECPACDGTRIVKFTGSSRWIKHGAGLVISEISEQLFRVFILSEESGTRISRKCGGQAGDSFTRTLSDCGCALRVVAPQFIQAVLEPGGVELADREDAHTALRTARTANEPRTTPSGRIGESGIDDLDQGLVSARQGRRPHK
jgi:hypothetical protein